jgi:hypothetical protein
MVGAAQGETGVGKRKGERGVFFSGFPGQSLIKSRKVSWMDGSSNEVETD